LAYRPKQDFGGALAFVEAGREPGDVVATAGLAVLPYRRLYRTDWQEVDSPGALRAIRAQARRTWFVYTLPTHAQAVYPDLMADVQQHFALQRRFDGSVGDGAVYVLRADSPDRSSNSAPAAEGQNGLNQKLIVVDRGPTNLTGGLALLSGRPPTIAGRPADGA
jgi:hypothetical protein